jgi:hypothetical protein
MRSGHLRNSWLYVSKKRRGSNAIVVVLTVSTWPTTRRGVPNPTPKNEEKGMGAARPPAQKDQCKWCFKRGHYQKNCIQFLKHLNKTCEDHVTLIDESLFLSYAKSTWWIDSGATIHIANSI